MTVLCGKHRRRPRGSADTCIGNRLRQNAGLNLARHRCRAKLHRTSIRADRTGVADQGRAVDAAEAKRVVSLNAVALGAALHVCSAATCRSFFVCDRPGLLCQTRELLWEQERFQHLGRRFCLLRERKSIRTYRARAGLETSALQASSGVVAPARRCGTEQANSPD